MLNRAISQSKKMAGLSSDTSRLLFTWMIPHLDRDGRMKAEPSLFKNIVCPRLKIGTKVVEKCLKEWHECGAVILYESDDDQYLFCVGWDRQQVGLRYDRSAASRCPAPPKDLLRTNSGPTPARVPRNGMELNRIEKGGDLALNLLDEVQGKVAENQISENKEKAE